MPSGHGAIRPGPDGPPPPADPAPQAAPKVASAPVKAAGFLTRDSRTVERKKYGKAKARRSFQFSKR